MPLKPLSITSLHKSFLERMWLPEVHWKAAMSEIPDDLTYKETVLSYMKNLPANINKGQGLYLWGDFGRGKSAIAAICLKAAAIFGRIGFWVRAKELPSHIIEHTIFDEELTVRERCETCCLLVIDEFQIRKDLAYSESSVEDLVRKRIDSQLSTIITTNVVPATLKDKFPAMYSVLQEALYPVRIDGYDFRSKMKGKIK